MSDYPKGAIRSSDEILDMPGGTVVYCASKTYNGSALRRIVLTGHTGVEYSRIRHVGKTLEYRYYEYKTYNREEAIYKGSLKDMNIDQLNEYNDWFMFKTEEDALAYLQGETDEVSP